MNMNTFGQIALRLPGPLSFSYFYELLENAIADFLRTTAIKRDKVAKMLCCELRDIFFGISLDIKTNL